MWKHKNFINLQLYATFKHFYDAGTIGSGTVKFRHYSQQEPTPPTPAYTDCLTFTGETSEFTLAVGAKGAKEWDGTVYYSTDHNTWNIWDGTAISSANKKIYLRGKGNTKFFTSKGACLSLSAKAGCTGNIQTLLDWENPPTAITTRYCYRFLFRDCALLTSAPELTATTLYESCYEYIFWGCKSLTYPPALPAIKLESSCYYGMFIGCKSLKTAPELPAVNLAYICYTDMFNGCTSLTTPPELPATVLADACYENMFKGCTSLKISSTQTAEYKTPWRIPSSGTISTTATNWSNNMLQNTGGTFTDNPSINTTYYGAW